MTDGPPRTLSQTEMLRWIDGRRRGSQGGFTDWVMIQRIAKNLTRDSTSDLRSQFERAIQHNRPLETRFAFALMTFRWFGEPRFDYEMFLGGASLGPLKTLQIYSTDFSAFDVVKPNTIVSAAGKAHAPFHCQHSEGISRFDDLLSYEEFLSRYSEWDRWAEEDSHRARYALCSFCGGASIRLLTDEQLSYYRKIEQESKDRTAAEERAGVTRLRPRPR
jgi:hypothetical protein